MNSDGYEWIKRFDKNVLQKVLPVRKMILFYFNPFYFEKYKNGLIYRIIGVHRFGRYLPTGGINIRRWTKRKMQSYTLKGLSLNAAEEFRYKSCFFEFLHIPFFAVLIWRSLWWYFKHNNIDLAIELLIVNAIINIYPIMHQRYTRIRINRLIDIKKQRRTRFANNVFDK